MLDLGGNLIGDEEVQHLANVLHTNTVKFVLDRSIPLIFGLICVDTNGIIFKLV
jgi:hypothetical protein